MAKKELKRVEGNILTNCRACSYYQILSKESEIYYCREFNTPILNFKSFPKECQFESIFKINRTNY